MYSSFDFGYYSILSVKTRGGGGLLKHDKSYLPAVPETVAWTQHLFLHYLLFTYFYLFSLNIISNLLCQCNKGDKLKDHQQMTFELFSRIFVLISPLPLLPPSLRDISNFLTI